MFEEIKYVYRQIVSDIMQNVFGMFFAQAQSMISSHGADGAPLQR